MVSVLPVTSNPIMKIWKDKANTTHANTIPIATYAVYVLRLKYRFFKIQII
jgi:hypothetical protein